MSDHILPVKEEPMKKIVYRYFSRLSHCFLLILSIVFYSAAFNTTITVNTTLDTHAISPYIYGSNQNFSGTENLSAMRQGGNRLTGYNWENNASNAGKDWYNSSDNLIPASMGIPSGRYISKAMLPQ